MRQTELTEILEQSFKARERKLNAYIRENALEYIGYAKAITPCYHNNEMIWDRVAFSILSANTGFKQTVKALSYATEHKGNVSETVLMGFGMVPAKAKFLNLLPYPKMQTLLKGKGENWLEYRLRLKNDIAGLGLAKASFAVSLLYPLKSDVACIDTWICKHFLGSNCFKQLGLKAYLAIEGEIRKKARKFALNTFLTQWLIWDCLRREKNNHSVFPFSDKGENEND